MYSESIRIFNPYEAMLEAKLKALKESESKEALHRHAKWWRRFPCWKKRKHSY